MSKASETLRQYPILLPEEARRGSVDPETFKSAFRLHPAGVAVVTADPTGDEPAALTVSSLASVSTEPPMLIFSVSALSSSASALERSDTVVVHMLGADHLDIAKLGATSGIDRFADRSAWRRLPTGEPVFNEVYSWLRGDVVFRLKAGNSTIFIVHVLEAHLPDVTGSTSPATAPLVYHARTWHQLGDGSRIA